MTLAPISQQDGKIAYRYSPVRSHYHQLEPEWAGELDDASKKLPLPLRLTPYRWKRELLDESGPDSRQVDQLAEMKLTYEPTYRRGSLRDPTLARRLSTGQKRLSLGRSRISCRIRPSC